MDYILMSLRLETRAGFGDCVSRRTCLFTLCNFLWYKTCLFCVTCRQTYDQFENNQKIIRCFCRPTLSSTSVDKHRRLLDPNVSSVLSRLYQQLLVNVPQWQQSHGNIWILNAPLRSLQHTKENLLWPAVGLLQKQLSSDYYECKEVVLVVMTVLWAWVLGLACCLCAFCLSSRSIFHFLIPKTSREWRQTGAANSLKQQLKYM